MKKIWNTKILLIIALICALYYLLFMEFSISNFPNGHSATEEVGYSMEMTRKFGNTIEPKELSEFVSSARKDLIEESEGYIRNDPIFANAKIYSYSDYAKLKEKTDLTNEESSVIMQLFGENCNYVGARLQAINTAEERYHNYTEYTISNLISENSGKKELARITMVQETKEYRNIMDGWAFENTTDYAVHLAILSVLSVLVLVSPLIVTDRTGNLHLLQYTSKQGRSILKNQFTAVILSAFLLTTLLLLIFGAVYSTNSTFVFWNNGLTSFLNFADIFWFNLTYGQYIIIYVVLLYTLCIGASAIAFVLSRFSQNIIALILKLIPIFALLGVLCSDVFSHTFSNDNKLYMITGIIGIEPVVCIIVSAVLLAASFFIVNREKNIDVI